MHDHPSSSQSSAPSTLAALGFAPRFAEEFELHATPGSLPARVVRVDAQGCTVLAVPNGGEAVELHVHVPKRLARKRAPAVGDWAIVRTKGKGGERDGDFVVRKLLERATSLTRRAAGSSGRAQVLAANLDRVLVCSSLDRDFKLTRLERWLSLVHEGGAEPVVVLTKAGLVDEATRARRVEAAREVALGVSVIAVDRFTGVGLDALDACVLRAVEEDASSWAPTLALVGSSGVGKSTLLNYLCELAGGEGAMATGSISSAHGKGRHTTSHRELVALPERDGLRALLIDTPGLREVGLWGEGEGVDKTFAEIGALARGCRFGDCQHAGEPGCAVRAAVDEGRLEGRRLEAYRRLVDERETTARRANEHERRRHERRFAKEVRRTIRIKRGRED